MSGLIGDVIEGVVDFFTDVWLLRRHRAVRGRPENALGKDATNMVVFNFWTGLASLAAMALFALMFFLLKLPLVVSLVPVVAGVAYVVYRWYALVRE